jgi:phosphoglycerate kinase
MAKMTVRDIEVKGKRVLCRVDFNVPLDDQRRITDDARIRESMPTIRHILDHGGRLILVAHFGRPKGKVNDAMRLTPVAKHLSGLLGKEVPLVDPFVAGGWEKAEAASKSLRDGEAMMLENIRFDPGEEKGDDGLAQRLAKLADVYVNDAFGAAHRAHVSTTTVAKHLQPAVAGLLMEKELKYLGQLLADPERPFLAIIGGAKISSKIGVLESLLQRVDQLLLGGAMAYTFFKAKGLNIGNSLFEAEFMDTAKKLLDKWGGKIVLPVDTVYADAVSENAKVITYLVEEVPEKCEMQGLDIGPETISVMEDAIMTSKTIFWNGPLGVFEVERFAEGTNQVARFIVESGATSIVGGGESAAAVREAGFAGQVTHISTGGGASLEFVEGKELPGVAALTEKR